MEVNEDRLKRYIRANLEFFDELWVTVAGNSSDELDSTDKEPIENRIQFILNYLQGKNEKED